MGSAVRFPSGSGLRGEHRKGGTPASHVSQRATRRSDWEEVNPAWFLKLGLLKYNLHSVKCTRLGVYSDKCVQLCFYHHDQDPAHFRHPPKPPLGNLWSVPPLPLATTPLFSIPTVLPCAERHTNQTHRVQPLASGFSHLPRSNWQGGRRARDTESEVGRGRERAPRGAGPTPHRGCCLPQRQHPDLRQV